MIGKDIAALFIPTSNAGVAYYRMFNWCNAAHKNRAGLYHMLWWDKAATETHPWEGLLEDSMRKHRILAELDEKCGQADVIVMQMLHFKAGLDLFCAIKDRFPDTPIIVEQDDQMLETASYNPASESYRPGSYFSDIAIKQMQYADAMVVSTNYLKDVYSQYCDNIFVAPNSLDFRIWDNLKHRKNKDIIRIGWAGGASHDEDLRIIEPVVHKILEKHPTVRFNFVHGIPEFFKGIDRVETFQQWTRIDRYPQMLASRSFDIMLAPLRDNAFNRGKSNLRWLESAGLKAPCVASSVMPFAETITQAQDGLLCKSEQDWIDSLSWLISDEVSRRKIGKNANATARRRFNVDTNVFKYSEELKKIAARGQVVKVPQPDEDIPDNLVEAHA